MSTSFRCELSKTVEEIVSAAVKKEVKDLQALFDRLARTHKGKSIEEVKRALVREWERRTGAKISDPELTEYAKAISEGARITVSAPPHVPVVR